MYGRVLLGSFVAVAALFVAAPVSNAAPCWNNPDGSQDCVPVSSQCAGGEVDGHPVRCAPVLDPMLPPPGPVGVQLGIGVGPSQ